MEKSPMPQGPLQAPQFHAREAEGTERFVLDAAYEKAKKIFRHEIDMESFATSNGGNYDPEMVQKDLLTVTSLREKFAQRASESQALEDVKHISDVFEAMLADQIKSSNWFGGNTELIASSEYDDYVHHVDGVLHFKVPGASDYLALGTDVTFSKASVEEKISHIKKNIADGRMAQLKYFELPDKSFKGALNNVPYIVLGADSKSVLQMAEQWVSENGGKYLSKHWMQAQLMDMAILQCGAFKQFAIERSQKAAEEKYGYMERKLIGIRSLKAKISGPLPTDRDSMFKTVKDVLGA